MIPLMTIFSGFGLSAAAGLNAYIPLLIVSVLANRGMIHLAPPYDGLGSGWYVLLLAVLCLVELVVDKVPGADHVNDVVQTVVRPAAGALLFASQAGIIHGVPSVVWIVSGLLLSGTVHGIKAGARPVVNFGTVGLGAPILSSIDNMVSTVLTILAIVAPILCMIVLVLFAVILYRAFRLFVRRPRSYRISAVPVPAETGEPLLEAAREPV